LYIAHGRKILATLLFFLKAKKTNFIISFFPKHKSKGFSSRSSNHIRIKFSKLPSMSSITAQYNEHEFKAIAADFLFAFFFLSSS